MMYFNNLCAYIIITTVLIIGCLLKKIEILNRETDFNFSQCKNQILSTRMDHRLLNFSNKKTSVWQQTEKKLVVSTPGRIQNKYFTNE